MSEPASQPQPQAGTSPHRPPWRAIGRNWRTAAIGFGAGLLNGLLGVGGGILIVPGLIFVLDVTPRVAVSTSLGAVLCLAVLALGVHLAISGLYFSVLGSAVLLAAGVAGSQVGGYLLNRIPQRWILYFFAAFTFVASTHLILQALGTYGDAGAAAVSPPLWSYAAIGAMSGFFSGMLGVGGGGIVVIGFAALYHTPILGGIPLALAVNVVNAGSGVIAQWRTGQILWRQVVRLVPAAVVGIAAGVALAIVMPAEALKVVFALFFMYMGSRLIRRGARS